MCNNCKCCNVKKLLNCPCFLQFIIQLIDQRIQPSDLFDIDLNNIALGDGNGSLIDSHTKISTTYSTTSPSDSKVLTEKAVYDMIYAIVNAHTQP